MRRISNGYSDIMVMLSREISTFRLSSSPTSSLKKKLRTIDSLLDIHIEVIKAFEKFKEECLQVIYGSRISWDFGIPEPVIIAYYHPTFRYLGASKAICIPRTEAVNLCRWSTIAHESVHSKYDDIIRVFRRYDNAEKEDNKALMEKHSKVLNRLVSDPPKVRDKISEVGDLFTNVIKLRAGEVYRESYSLLFGDDFYLPQYFLEFQFEEVLADVACTKITGPADTILLAHSTADSCRNPELDIYTHLHDLVHPPSSVRVMYETEILEGADINLKGKRIDGIKRQLHRLVGIDILGRKTADEEDLSRYLIKVYFDGVKSLLPEISELVDLLLAENTRFDRTRWNAVIDCYDELNKGKPINDMILRPFDLTNLAWLKVMDIFNNTIGEGKSYKDFLRARERKREDEDDFFNTLWKYLVSH